MRTDLPTPSATGAAPAAGATRDLTALLDEVATTDLDAPAWAVLARRARVLTADLAARGLVPHHLVATPTDPPVVTARLLSAAWRSATAAPVGARSTVRAACA